MSISLNSDSFQIKNYEMTPEGYLKFWIVGGIPDKELIYDGGDRIEKINADALFDETSINSAIGKPISLNHPPQPINSKNYRKYANGIILQEYAKDEETGALVLAGIIHDADVVDGVMKDKFKFVSAGYTADKEPNADGVLIQSGRKYNHFAILSEDFAPRAGEESKIVLLDENYDASDIEESGGEESGGEESDSEESDAQKMPGKMKKKAKKQNDSVQIDMKKELAERVELLTRWKSLLEEHNKAIDYNADAKQIKRQVMGIYYPEKTMRLITDSNIDGVWIGFITTANLDSETGSNEFSPTKPVYKSRSAELNFDAAVESEIDKFVKKIEGRK